MAKIDNSDKIEGRIVVDGFSLNFKLQWKEVKPQEESCPVCGGSGDTVVPGQDSMDWYPDTETCRRCNGYGRMPAWRTDYPEFPQEFIDILNREYKAFKKKFEDPNYKGPFLDGGDGI
jgi:hypothetical protein